MIHAFSCIVSFLCDPTESCLTHPEISVMAAVNLRCYQRLHRCIVGHTLLIIIYTHYLTAVAVSTARILDTGEVFFSSLHPPTHPQ